jgi:pimeloyl-ACP methyl ester carboxylesterase
MRSRAGRAALLHGTLAKPGNVPPELAIALDRTFHSCPTFDPHLRATRRDRFRDGNQIDAPVTVAWGEKERILPAKARRRDELPAGTRYVELPGVGHLMMWDDPELVARTILEGSAVERS